MSRRSRRSPPTSRPPPRLKKSPQTTIDALATHSQDAAAACVGSVIGWCGREDSNFHSLSATATSRMRVYQFGHAHHEQGARMRDATVRSTDGTVQTARLVEFE